MIGKDLLKKITNKTDEVLIALVQQRNNTDARVPGLPAISEIDQALFLLGLEIEECNKKNRVNQKRV